MSEFRTEYKPLSQFIEEDYDKSSRRIRDNLPDKNRYVFASELASFETDVLAKEAGLMVGQLYRTAAGAVKVIA